MYELADAITVCLGVHKVRVRPPRSCSWLPLARTFHCWFRYHIEVYKLRHTNLWQSQSLIFHSKLIRQQTSLDKQVLLHLQYQWICQFGVHPWIPPRHDSKRRAALHQLPGERDAEQQWGKPEWATYIRTANEEYRSVVGAVKQKSSQAPWQWLNSQSS